MGIEYIQFKWESIYIYVYNLNDKGGTFPPVIFVFVAITSFLTLPLPFTTASKV